MREPLDSPTHYREGIRGAVAPWRAQAKCLCADPALFFPERYQGARRLPGGNHDPGVTRRTINEYCVPCPVRSECLAEGLKERFGVWGGTTPKERRRLRNQDDIIRLMKRSDSSTATSAQIGAQQ